ncbi:PIR Superfamily Protein [Plasmodium ovale curtisi]|uniref:PIR Superfamily Protein n=1 Tax=Plasmodium ovale curtisi TaxID=864141 RepID=A0A1A8WR62_PLAOA|nr:PIR Superfamily Protein [Plasmodium ovale curtisi]
MTLNNVKIEERYAFFKSADFYMNKAESVALKNKVSKGEEYCNSFLNDSLFTHVPNREIFCAQFKKLYDLLYNGTRVASIAASLDDIDRAFLNYWLNDKLRGTNIDKSISVNDFYKELRTKNNNIFKDKRLEDKLYNIESYDLENMRKLYDLYNIKNKISYTMVESTPQEESALCLTYTKECYGKYRDAIINCLGDCFDFYTALTDFRNKFEEDLSPFTKSSISCKYKELFELPDYETVLIEHKSGPFKRIITLPVLFPLLGMLFTLIFSDTLTSFGQKGFEKIKSTKNMLLGARKRRNLLLLYTSDNDRGIEDQEEYSISYYSA